LIFSNARLNACTITILAKHYQKWLRSGLNLLKDKKPQNISRIWNSDVK
jgi:hypothetical protein